MPKQPLGRFQIAASGRPVRSRVIGPLSAGLEVEGSNMGGRVTVYTIEGDSEHEMLITREAYQTFKEYLDRRL